MKITKEVMEAHRAALQEMARMYEAAQHEGEGLSSVAVWLGKADRQIGRLLDHPHVPEEPKDKEPDTEHFRDG